MRPSRTSSAIFSTIAALFTMYGISVTTIAVRPPRISSKAARARTVTRPRPVRYAWRIPLSPQIKPPVGKSGPWIRSSTSSTLASGFRAISTSASTTSPRLCGGTLVAIPTAMPEEPLMSRLGMRAGSTTGSVRVLS